MSINANEKLRVVRCHSDGTLVLGEQSLLTLPPHSELPLALVRIEAFGINRADLLQRAGYYPAPSGVVSDVLGLEFAGVIEAITPSSSFETTTSLGLQRPKVGDRVMGICAGGGYAEQIITPLDQLLPVPKFLSINEAAALPEVYLTAFDALTHQAQLRFDEKVLIHAIGSGVGSTATHIAKLLGAQYIVGTTRSEWKQKKALAELPVDEVWLSQEGHWLPQDHPSFEVMIDFIGGAYLQENLKALALGGRLVVVGLLGGSRAEINLGLLLTKRAQLIGTVLRSRSTQEKIELTQEFNHKILPKLIDGSLPPPIVSKVYSVSQLEEAHEHLARDASWSKLVCVWNH